MRTASPYYRRMLAIQSAGEKTLNKKLAAAIAGKDDSAWREFEDGLRRAIFISMLAGVASARVLDPSRLHRPGHVRSHYADDAMFKISPFERAVRFMTSRASIPDRRVEELSLLARKRAFWITGVTKMETVELFKRRIADFAAGKSVPVSEFVRAAKAISDSHAETVLRTNLSRAFNQAHVDEVAGEMGKFVALLRLDEVHDNRTRGNPNGLYPNPDRPHWQMDGYLAAPRDPVWSIITPPNGYNCRASTTAITWDTAERMGLLSGKRTLNHSRIRSKNGIRQKLIDSGVYPDPGFGI